MTLAEIRQQIKLDPQNKKMEELGYEPVYTANPEAKLTIVGRLLESVPR